MKVKITSLRRWKQLRKSQNMFLNLEDSAKDMVNHLFSQFKNDKNKYLDVFTSCLTLCLCCSGTWHFDQELLENAAA